MRRKLFLGLAGTVIALLVAEGMFWIQTGSLPPGPLYPGDVIAEPDATFDALVGWKLPPSKVIDEQNADYSVQYRSNPQGFRSPHNFDRLRGRTRRLVFVGDSYTFGSGVALEDTFASLLGNAWRRTRSFNLGIGAFGVDQMWLTLRHYGLALEPDLVVLSFIRNDLDRSLTAYRKDHIWREKPLFRIGKGRLQRVEPKDRPPAIWRFLQQKSRLFGLARKVESSLGRRFAVGYRWRLNRAIFEQIRDDCRTVAVPLLVVHLPVNRRHEVPMFAPEFEAMGIEFLDLTPLLPENAEDLYFPSDHHFNDRGHRFAAEAIREAIVQRDLLTRRSRAAQGAGARSPIVEMPDSR